MRADNFAFLLLCFGGVVSGTATPVFNIESCGSRGDNATLNTAAIQKCIDQAVAFVYNGGGNATVLVPTGVFLTGAVTLTGPNLTLAFAPGGYLQGSADSSDYGLDWG